MLLFRFVISKSYAKFVWTKCSVLALSHVVSSSIRVYRATDEMPDASPRAKVGVFATANHLSVPVLQF